MLKYLLGTTLAAVLSLSSAQAATIVGSNAFGTIYHAPPGNVNNITGVTEHKVFLDAEGTPDTSFIGHVDSQNGTPLVQFTTDDPVTSANGFAQIGNGGGGSTELFNTLSITVPGFFIHDLLFDTQGAADVTISGFLNNVALLSQQVLGLGNGQQSWLILATPLSNFDRIVLSSVSGFAQVTHFQVSGSRNNLTPTPNTVPLPAGVWLFGTALAGMGALKMRRRRAAAAA